jgi:molybdopterin/thiamine biosynthesis adenylyltransferase
MKSLALLKKSVSGRNERGRVMNGFEDDSVVICHIAQHPEAPRSAIPMCFTKSALAAMVRSIGGLPPESGAMGFGPMGTMGFDLIEFDEIGSSRSGGAVYRPHVEWCEKRRQFHQDQPESSFRLLHGFAHSHPGSFGSPSSKAGRGLGDLGYVEEVFAMNEWMEYFLLPILTGTDTDEITIHPWICRRGNPVDLMIADFKICRASRDFPVTKFNPEWEIRVSPQPERTGDARQADDNSEAVLAGTREPVQGKKPVRSNRKAETFSAVSPGGRVVADVDRPEGTSERPEAQLADEDLHTDAPERTCITEKAMNRSRIAAVGEYTKRLNGIVSGAFRDKNILVVGVGAGSYMVEKLARLCPRSIKVCDFDTVELSNLARTAYRIPDVAARRLKVEALKLRLHEVNPWVGVRTYAKSVTDMTKAELEELFERIDLAVGGTDSLVAQALVNEECGKRGIPAVFIGIHAGAQGGRVIWSIPGKTPCYRCVARDRFESEGIDQVQPADLQAANGSIVDCQFIDMIATKIGVAILERGQRTAMGRFFDKMNGRNDVVIRCDPEYQWGQALWGAILGDLPKTPRDYALELNEEAFLAMDSIWLKSTCDPACPVCGDKPNETRSEVRNED